MRFVQLAAICCVLAPPMGCGSGTDHQDSTSVVSSTYGKLQWLDTDYIKILYPKPVQDMVAAAVVLSKKTHSFTENGFCSGGLVEYRDQAFLFTAGHCLKTQEECEETYLIPDFEFQEDRHNIHNTILKCSELLTREQTGQVLDYAIARYEVFRLSTRAPLVEPFPLRFSKTKAGQDLMGAGHPSNLDDELVQEIREKSEINWDEVYYLNAGYTLAKKTAHSCMTFVSNSSYFTHNCDTRQGFSGAVLYTYPELAFAGIHFHGGKSFAVGDRIEPNRINRGTAAAYIKQKLDEIIDNGPSRNER